MINQLTDIELYFSKNCAGNKIIIENDELHHIINVMRHKVDDNIYVTNGEGKIFFCRIEKITKERILCIINNVQKYENKYSNIVFCIPRLKNNERFEFAIEKSIELGITNFIFFESERTVAKGFKVERIKKLILSAIKQSLRAWLPSVVYIKNIIEINDYEGEKILLDQKANECLIDFLINNKEKLSIKKIYFIFGPEGGFSYEELNKLNKTLKLKLTENRLRSETAIISTASLLATLIQ